MNWNVPVSSWLSMGTISLSITSHPSLPHEKPCCYIFSSNDALIIQPWNTWLSPCYNRSEHLRVWPRLVYDVDTRYLFLLFLVLAFICFVDTESHVAQANFQLIIQSKINLNFWSFCLHLPSSVIVRIDNHAQFQLYWGWNTRLCACWASILPTGPHPQHH